MVGLNATLGRRGVNAVRLLAGVLIGVVVGELAVWLIGDRVLSLAVATFVAMLLARAVDDARIVLAQAGVSAVLVTVLGDADHGWDRLLDAVIGSAVTLLFSQLLFAPEPLRVLRRAESVVLAELAASLDLIHRALERDELDSSAEALDRLRRLRDRLTDLSTVRRASGRVVRHSLIWRRRGPLVVGGRERADQLDLLAGSCLLLARTAMAVPPAGRGHLTALVRPLANSLHDLADDPGDQATRQDAATSAGQLLAWSAEHGGQVDAQSALATAYAAVRMVAIDVIVFAGADTSDADPADPSSSA